VAHVRGAQRVVRSSSRRKTAWSLGPATGSAPGSPQTISAGGTTLGLLGSTPSIDGLTLIRLRGNLVLRLETAGSAGDGFVGAFGICQVGNEAFSAGASALPDPQDDGGDERWFYHQYFEVKSLQTTQALVGNSNTASRIVDVDSKAMRKSSVDQVLICMLGVEETGVSTMAWMFQSRVLDKLP